MRSYPFVLLITASVALAACGGGSGRGPAAPSPSGITVSGPSSAVASGSTVSWSCFTRAAGTGTFGTSDCPPLRAPAAPLRPATAAPITAPGAPANFSATVTGSTVVLNWTAPVGGDAPTSYSVQAGSTNGASDLANVDTGTTATTLTELNVPAGTYFVRIRANNSAGQSTPSNAFQAVARTQPPPVFASFRRFGPATTGGPVTECRLRAPNNSSPLTCTLRGSAFTLGTATISTYSWLVRYTHGTQVEISRTDANPNLSFT